MRVPTLLVLSLVVLVGPTSTSHAADEAPTCLGPPATIVGGAGQVTGTEGPDVIVASGNSTIDALGGDDLVCLQARSAVASAVGSASASPVPTVWVQPVTLSPAELKADSAMVTLDEDSGLHAVWRVMDAGHWRVQVARRPYGGTWSKPKYLSPPGYDASKPRISVASYNTTLTMVGWVLSKPAGAVVQVTTSPEDTDTWSSPVDVSAPGEPVTDADVVVSTPLKPLVFWRGYDGTHWRVRAALVSREGDEVVRTRTLSAPGGDAADLSLITTAENDGERVTWSRFDGANWRAESFHFNGFPGRAFELQSIAIPGEDLRTPVVGTLWAAWTNTADGLTRVRAAQLKPGQSPVGPPVTLSTGNANAGHLAAQESGGGDVSMVWSQQVPNSAQGTVVATTGNPSEGTWQPSVQLSTPDVLADNPALDGFAATWTERVDSHWRLMYGQLGSTATPVMLSGPDVDAGAGFMLPGTGDGWVQEVGGGVAWTEETATGTYVRLRGLDGAGPYTWMDPIPYVQLGRSVKIRWQAKDDWSPIAGAVIGYRVQAMTAGENDNWDGHKRVPATANPARVRVQPGRRYCFRPNGVDSLGHVYDGWTNLNGNCAVTPVDDRMFHRKGSWSPLKSSSFYWHTALATTRRGDRLITNLTHVKRLRLLTAIGPGFGTINVSFRGNAVTLDLANATPAALKLPALNRLLPNHGTSGRLTITVTSPGKPVRIDGVLAG